MMDIICSGLQFLVMGLVDYFIGIVCIDVLFKGSGVLSGVIVMFEFGVCIVWYIYLFGQIIVILLGFGCVQWYGGLIEEVCFGDIVFFVFEEKYWYGGVVDCVMSYMVIVEMKDGKVVDWFEQVIDD